MEQLVQLVFKGGGGGFGIAAQFPALDLADCPLGIFGKVVADPEVRAVVLTGTGDVAFCAGGDLGLTLPLMTGARAPQDEFDRRLLDDPRTLAASSLRGFDIVKPTICAINGTCLAAGFELMLGTDIRIAAEQAQFGLPEVQRALLPFAGSMARLPRQVPAALAMQLLLTGRPISAELALQWGLVTELWPSDRLLPRALELAEQSLPSPSEAGVTPRLNCARTAWIWVASPLPSKRSTVGVRASRPSGRRPLSPSVSMP